MPANSTRRVNPVLLRVMEWENKGGQTSGSCMEPPLQLGATVFGPLVGKSWRFNAALSAEDEVLDPVKGWELELGCLHKAEVGNELFLL